MTELVSHTVAPETAGRPVTDAPPGGATHIPPVGPAQGRTAVARTAVARTALVDPTGGRRASGRSGFGGRQRVPPELRRVLGPALLFLAWLAVTGFHLVSDRSLASPGAVFSAGRQLWDSGDLTSSLAASLYRVGISLLFGVSVGLVLAVAAGFFRVGEDVIDSAMNFLRTIPVIALLPLIIVWIGIGEDAKIFLIAVGVAFPVYMNTYAAIRGVDAKLVEVGQTFGLSRFGLIRRVIVPGAVPGVLVGLRWAIGVAWLLLVFAEQVNTEKGIGYLLNNAQSWNRTDIIVLCLVIYGILGLLSDGLVRLLERSLLSWRRGFAGT
jgi:sulfonate transport system permease protein